MTGPTPIKSIIAKDEKPPRKLPPQDQYTVVCCDIDDLGLKDKTYQGKPKGKQRRIGLVFQLDAVDPDTGKRYEQTEYFWLSLGEKSTLSKFLETWRGKPFTDAERKGGWELMKLIGACGLGTITHVHKGDKTYANMNTVVKLPRGMPYIEPVDFVPHTIDRIEEAPEMEHDSGGESAEAEDDMPF